MVDFNLLSILIGLPLIGALFIAFFVKSNDEKSANNAKQTAFWVTISTFIFSLFLLQGFDPSTAEFQFVEKYDWFSTGGFAYFVGVDGISILFILLTTFLMPICILASLKTINFRVKEYMVSFLMLEAIIIGIFSALDLFLFYVFFEIVLIPMFLIIGIWGGENRVYASLKFFLYTLTGSMLMLPALIYIYVKFGTTDIILLTNLVPGLGLEVQKYLWLAFLASFAIKVPMWPVHTWLPDAHVQAPTAGSVILAGVLLKLGGYGLIRWSLPLFPHASEYFASFIFILSVIAIIYTSLVALVQKDMKKLIAYSSVAHMGFVTLGIFTLNYEGLTGAVMVMLSHGLVSAALFLCVGVLYDRMHTKEIAAYSGVTALMPKFAFYFMIFSMASVGLPGTSGFIGELLTMVGAFKVDKLIASLSAIGIILTAAYMLWLYARVMFGEVTSEEVKKMPDLNAVEKNIFLVIGIAVIFMGVYPSFFTDIIAISVENLILHLNATNSY